VGARIGLPGVDGRIVRDFFSRHPGGLLRLYDLLVGGAISRAAILALGVMPYLSALCYMAIAKSLSPKSRTFTNDAGGAQSANRWTRRLAVGLAMVQGYGYAKFVESIPGAVAHPGAGFVARTVIILTGATLLVIAFGEQIGAASHDHSPEQDEPSDAPADRGVDAGGVIDTLLITGPAVRSSARGEKYAAEPVELERR
jgi:preprotein translocase subunit SecY